MHVMLALTVDWKDVKVWVYGLVAVMNCTCLTAMMGIYQQADLHILLFVDLKEVKVWVQGLVVGMDCTC